MATGQFLNGDYEITDDSNGDLVVKDPNGTTVMKWDSANSQWDFQTQALANIGSVGTESRNGAVEFMGQTDDFQSKVDSTPTGGTLVLEEPGAYDVATVGTATIDKPMNLVMVGLGQGGDIDGAYLDNSGSDVVDSPVITLANETVGQFSTRVQQPVMRGVSVRHEGGTSAAIDVNEMTSVLWQHPVIRGNDTGQDGISLTNDSFLHTFIAPNISGFTRYGFTDEGATGGANTFIQPTFSAVSSTSGTTAYHTKSATYTGGQINGADIGIHADGGTLRGMGVRFESAGTGIKFGGANAAVNGLVDAPKFASINDYCVDFEQANGCEVLQIDNLVDGDSTGQAVRWGGSASECGISAVYNELAARSWNLGNGERNPFVRIENDVLNDALRDNISNPVEGMEIYNPDDGLPNYYNGTDWVLADGTTT